MMSDLSIALLTIFGTVASVTGVVLYVFNGTRNLIKEIHETQREIIEILKKGFGDLSSDIKELKIAK
ncbi:MAG: hypothetical protein AB1454_14945 [Candidatus Auribacterota bacterium]